jgi:hypothetical protein
MDGYLLWQLGDQTILGKLSKTTML